MLFLEVCFDSTVNGIAHFSGIVIVKDKTIALATVFVVLADSVSLATHIAYHRHRAVLEAIHLVQAAWLKE